MLSWPFKLNIGECQLQFMFLNSMIYGDSFYLSISYKLLVQKSEKILYIKRIK